MSGAGHAVSGVVDLRYCRAGGGRQRACAQKGMLLVLLTKHTAVRIARHLPHKGVGDRVADHVGAVGFHQHVVAKNKLRCDATAGRGAHRIAHTPRTAADICASVDNETTERHLVAQQLRTA